MFLSETRHQSLGRNSIRLFSSVRKFTPVTRPEYSMTWQLITISKLYAFSFLNSIGLFSNLCSMLYTKKTLFVTKSR